MSREYKPVTKAELDQFVKNYPVALDYSVSHISHPPMGFWCDFSNGKVWPEAIVARVQLWDGSDYDFNKQPEYEVVVAPVEVKVKSIQSN